MFGLSIGKLELSDYDEIWPIEFGKEKIRISNALKGSSIQVEHIGSTSVIGMTAKPIVDIALIIENNEVLDHIISKLTELGYEFRGQHNEEDPEHRYFVFNKNSKRYFHIHMMGQTSKDLVTHVKFRDKLRRYPELRDEYNRQKYEWAERTNWNKLQYSLSKDDLVNRALNYE